MRVNWASLPREEKLLFNPAFLALLLARTSQGHASEVKAPIPIPLSFVSLTVVLYGPARTALPRNSRTNLLRWIETHPDISATIPIRASALASLLREGLLFALAHRICSLADGGLSISPYLSLRNPRSSADEVTQCHRSALFMGRWLARAGSPETVLALFGVRP